MVVRLLGMGTGLGLSMIYGFVRQSDGQVKIYSEVGHGTRVVLYFPRVEAQEKPDGAEPYQTHDAMAASGQRILAVDDEPLLRSLITEVLTDAGYVTVEAADGPEALKTLCSKMPIDLLITDVGLPGGLNGRQVADAASGQRPDLKVFFVTGYAENAVLSHGHLESGMEVLTKPFTLETLAARVQTLLLG